MRVGQLNTDLALGALQSMRVNAAGNAYEAYSPSTLFQPSDATLTALAALTITANSLSIGTGTDAFSQTSFAANTFPARASTGNLVAKTITDSGLALAALTVAQGDIIYGTGAGTAAVLAKNTSSTRYLSNTGTSNNPAWAQVNMANGVTGTLPPGNGGTGTTSFGTTNGLVYYDGSALANSATGKFDPSTSVMTITGPSATLTQMPRLHFAFTGDADAALGYLMYTHDNLALAFDAYHNGSSWVSSHAGGNFALYKNGSELKVGFNSGTTKGSNFSGGFNLTDGVRFSADGKQGIGVAPVARLDIKAIAAGNIVNRITGHGSQSANVWEVTNASLTPKVWVDNNFHLNLADGQNLIIGASAGTMIGQSGSALSTYGLTPVGQQTVTGSRGGNAALANLLIALHNFGVIVDATS